MKALQIRRFGTPESLSLVELAPPVAGVGEALVRVEAAAINPSDIKNAAGLMSQTTLPRIPGRDFAGIVEEGPAEWLGRRVWGSGGEFGFTRDGSHAEYLQVPVAALSARPARLDAAQAASVGVAFSIAWLGLIEYAQAQAGETVLVIGANGSVGGAVAQLAHGLGCRVIAVDRHPATAEIAALASQHLLSDERLPERIRELTRGEGAAVVYDAVGGVMFEPAVRSLAHRGRLIEISATGLRRVGFDLADFYHNESRLFGADSLKLDAVTSARLLDRLAPMFESGALQPPSVQTRLGLREVIGAYQRVGRGEGGRHVIIND